MALRSVHRLIPALGAQLFVNQPVHDIPHPFHDHVFHEIAVITGGASVHHSIHGDERLARGDVVVIHPGQWHGYGPCPRLELFNLGLAPALLANELAWVRTDPLLNHLLPPGGTAPDQQVRRLHLPDEDLAAVITAMERIMALTVGKDPLLVRTEAIGHATVILGRLARHLPRRHVATAEDDRLTALAPLLEHDLTRAWALDELAHRAGCTREHLCRRFRSIYGAAPLAWQAQRRAERAAILLLTTDGSIAEIGRQVGWSDPNLFARRFRGLLATSPREFRTKHQLMGIERL